MSLISGLVNKFDKRYFDSERRFGYGGYSYDPKFFITNVVKDFIYHYELGVGDKILDVGCAKGFMLFDFLQQLPGLDVRGIDISNYALDTAVPNLKSIWIMVAVQNCLMKIIVLISLFQFRQSIIWILMGFAWLCVKFLGLVREKVL